MARVSMIVRGVVCAIAVIAVWVAVLASAARASYDMPLRPLHRSVLAGSDFAVVEGQGVADSSHLRVTSVSENGEALQLSRVRINAETQSLLRYQFGKFPRTLELSLVFRREDATEPETVTVPWPEDHPCSVDLREVSGWRGTIVEVGFAEYATPQIAPESVAFKPFQLKNVELWSPSLQGSMAALYTSWFDFRPWSLMSISALGLEHDVLQSPFMVPYLALGGILTLLLLALTWRWTCAQFIRRAPTAALVMWILLDAVWIGDLGAKHSLTEDVYASKLWNERKELVPDQDLAAVAKRVRDYFAATKPPRALLVSADSNYIFLRLIYLLLPLNAAPLEPAATQSWPKDNTFVLLYRDSRWRYEGSTGALVDGQGVRPFEGERLFILPSIGLGV
jgi:hypothetical protein